MPLLGFVILQLLPSYPSTNLRVAFTSIRPETSHVQCDIEEQPCLPCKVRREVRAQRDADWKKLKGISCFYKGTFVRNGSRASSWFALFFSVTPFLQILQWRVLHVLGATLLTLYFSPSSKCVRGRLNLKSPMICSSGSFLLKITLHFF